MADVDSEQTDEYTLSMSYDRRLLPIQLKKGLLSLATKDKNGEWVNAVDMNVGDGTKKFILGPWKPGYGLGHLRHRSENAYGPGGHQLHWRFRRRRLQTF
jgi:hypothetical protein